MNKKFRIYATYAASKFLGEFGGETEADAIANAEGSAELYASLCHQCAHEIDLGDVQDLEAEEIEASND